MGDTFSTPSFGYTASSSAPGSVNVIYSEPPKKKCSYCGSWVDTKVQSCPNCAGRWSK